MLQTAGTDKTKLQSRDNLYGSELDIRWKNKILIVLLLTGLVVVGGSTVYVRITAAQHSQSDDAYNLLRPSTNDGRHAHALDLGELQYVLQRYIESGQLNFSVYVEYLPTGKNIGVHQDNVAVAASLSKLPIVMELYRQKDLGHIDIHQELSIPAAAIDKRYGDLWEKGVGYKLTLEAATGLALTESDNTAAKMLEYYLGLAPDSTDITSYLTLAHGIEIKDDVPVTSPRSYAQLIKCLYTSCDNTKASSQKILSMMTHSKISLLRTGVPGDVTVADKFGVYYSGADNGFNDCGIVYSPAGDYLLCVMGTGNSDQVVTAHNAISNLVYQYIAKKAF